MRKVRTWHEGIFQAAYPTLTAEEDVLGSNLGLP